MSANRKIVITCAALLLSLLALPASAAALVDTPAHLMTKGLERSPGGGGWHSHCTGWHKYNATNYGGRCWSLHQRYVGYTTTGTGYVELTRRYGNWYWAYGYKLMVVERPCHIDGEEIANYEEFKKEWEERLKDEEEHLREEERSRQEHPGEFGPTFTTPQEIEKTKAEEPQPPTCPQPAMHKNLDLSAFTLIFLR